MDCKVFDLSCHAQSALWNGWVSLGLVKQSLIIIGVLLIVGGALYGVMQFFKRIGGWPAVIGACLLVVVGVLSLIPRKPEPKPASIEDAMTRQPRKKPRVRTILDMLPKR